MAVEIRSEIVRKIEELKAEVRSYEAALLALDRSGIAKTVGPDVRFYQMRPLDAIRIVLRESGRALSQEDLTNILLAGGAAMGKKRGKHNIRISIEMTLQNGKLKETDGLIGLPEWEDEAMFTTNRADTIAS
jgi:hypothetical protein